jgi:hypothetical protein
LILAILALKAKLKLETKCCYVAGHQDEKKRKVKSSKEKRKEQRERKMERMKRIQEVEIKGGTHAPLPEEPADADDHHPSDTSVDTVCELGAEKHPSDKVQLNVACDGHAGEAAEGFISNPTQALPPTLNPPYEGTKAMLRIGDVWITSNYADHIHFASTAPKLKDYCMRRHKWDTSTMELIYWDTIERNRRNMGWADKCRTMKVMHGWLPIMHNLGKYKRLKQCPGCPCHDETFEHMYNCAHPLMKKALIESKQLVLDRAKACRINKRVTEAFMTCIECGIKGTSAPTSNSIPELRCVLADQNAIGTTKLLQGYMAKSWVDAMKHTRVKQPYAMAKILQRSLWDTLFQKIWDTRNHILHHMPNVYRTAESTDLRERLKYYRDNGNLLLSHHDRALADHSDEAIASMGRLTRRKWVKHLDRLHQEIDWY